MPPKKPKKQTADEVMAASFALHLTPEDTGLPPELQARMAFMQSGTAGQQKAHDEATPKKPNNNKEKGKKRQREAVDDSNLSKSKGSKGKKGKRTKGVKIAPEDRSGGGGSASSNASMTAEIGRALQEHYMKVSAFFFLVIAAAVGVALVEAGEKNIGGLILWVAVLSLILAVVFGFFKLVVEHCMAGTAEHCCFNQGCGGCWDARRPTTDLTSESKIAMGDRKYQEQSKSAN
jgi:hypothetical protein